MGIGHQALAAFEELKRKNFFQKFDSVIDLGSQSIEPNYQIRAKDLIFDKEKNIQ